MWQRAGGGSIGGAISCVWVSCVVRWRSKAWSQRSGATHHGAWRSLLWFAVFCIICSGQRLDVFKHLNVLLRRRALFWFIVRIFIYWTASIFKGLVFSLKIFLYCWKVHFILEIYLPLTPPVVLIYCWIYVGACKWLVKILSGIILNKYYKYLFIKWII